MSFYHVTFMTWSSESQHTVTLKQTCQIFWAKAGVDQRDSVHFISQHCLLLCCYTSCPYVSPEILLLSSVSLTFFFIPKCYSSFILVITMPTLSLSWTEKLCTSIFSYAKGKWNRTWGKDDCIPGILLNSKIPLNYKEIFKILSCYF